jgi:hypothetical protein
MGTFSVDPLSEFNLKHIVPIEVAARIAHHHQLNIGCCGGNMALRSCTQVRGLVALCFKSVQHPDFWRVGFRVSPSVYHPDSITYVNLIHTY